MEASMIDRKNGDKPITFEVTIGESRWDHGKCFQLLGCHCEPHTLGYKEWVP